MCNPTPGISGLNPNCAAQLSSARLGPQRRWVNLNPEPRTWSQHNNSQTHRHDRIFFFHYSGVDYWTHGGFCLFDASSLMLKKKKTPQQVLKIQWRPSLLLWSLRWQTAVTVCRLRADGLRPRVGLGPHATRCVKWQLNFESETYIYLAKFLSTNMVDIYFLLEQNVHDEAKSFGGRRRHFRVSYNCKTWYIFLTFKVRSYAQFSTNFKCCYKLIVCNKINGFWSSVFCFSVL